MIFDSVIFCGLGSHGIHHQKNTIKQTIIWEKCFFGTFSRHRTSKSTHIKLITPLKTNIHIPWKTMIGSDDSFPLNFGPFFRGHERSFFRGPKCQRLNLEDPIPKSTSSPGTWRWHRSVQRGRDPFEDGKSRAVLKCLEGLVESCLQTACFIWKGVGPSQFWWWFARGHDKPRLMGVASHLLSSAYSGIVRVSCPSKLHHTQQVSSILWMDHLSTSAVRYSSHISKNCAVFCFPVQIATINCNPRNDWNLKIWGFTIGCFFMNISGSECQFSCTT